MANKNKNKKKKTSAAPDESAVSLSAGNKKRPSKKLVTILLICAVVLAGGAGVGIYFLVTGLSDPTIAAPSNVKIADFNQQSDFLLKIVWDEVEGAVDYTVDYTYALHPDTPIRMTVLDSYYLLERKRGLLTFKVTANGKNGIHAESTEQTFFVDDMTLSPPALSSLSAVADAEGNIRFSWGRASYSYLNKTSEVMMYEWVEEFYYYLDEEGYILDDISRTSVKTRDNFLVYYNGVSKFTNDGYAKIVLKIRSINTTQELGTATLINGPAELYDIYGLSEWVEIEFILSEA